MSVDFSAAPNSYWTAVRVSGRPVLLGTLRELAEAWADDRDASVAAMDRLAAGLHRTEGGWDEAVYDLQADLRLSDTDDVDVDVVAKVRRKVVAVADLPHQQDRRAS